MYYRYFHSLFAATILVPVLLASCQSSGSKTDASPAVESDAENEPAGIRKYFESLSFSPEYSFTVEATDTGSQNILTIIQEGHEVGDTFTHVINGKVYNAESIDLNGDGFPELLVFISSADDTRYGSIVAYSSNKGKSLSQAAMPDIREHEEAREGYQGMDAFDIYQDQLTRRYPIYGGSGADARPTGFNRQITYELVDGEASRVFRVKEVIRYRGN